MEITGKIIAVLPTQSGVAQRTGNPWKTQEYVIETHDTYPKKCCFKVFGDEKISRFNIQMGEEMTVSFDINAREYNGKWFNSVDAWNVTRMGAAQGAPQSPVVHQTDPLPDSAVQGVAQPPFPPSEPADENDALPF